MGLLGAAIFLRWILKYRDIRSVPVTALSFLGFGIVIGFFWYSDEIVISTLIPFGLMLLWAYTRRPRVGPVLAAAGGFIAGYLPAIIYRLQGGALVLHTGIAALSEVPGNIRVMLQSFAWGMFSIPYASHPVAIAVGLFVLALSAAFLFWTPWETLKTRILVISPLYVNMVLFAASTMPVDMYDIRYLYPGLYTLGATTAIFVAFQTRRWSTRATPTWAAATLVLLAALLYDGQSFVHGVSTAGPDATVLATKAEVHWLAQHHLTTGWGYYWDVYMLDLMGYPHLNYVANSNLNIRSMVRRAELYCRREDGCPVILNTRAPSPIYEETPVQYSPKAVGALRYTALLQNTGGYYVYQTQVMWQST
jgi:hypothetical protein